MPVCIDPSHSAGTRAASSDNILDIFHVTAQGVIAGANMVLVDFHPKPEVALVDGAQALLLEELPYFIEDVRIAREAYEQRREAYRRFNPVQAKPE
jgi:3-deoxy-7-phosphoheptulonate synthase